MLKKISVSYWRRKAYAMYYVLCKLMHVRSMKRFVHPLL